ncbi:hypothetical protein C7B65_25715 [Phormidesmis priestleyi ULC007]|uniref:Plasmid mobilization relaxosome protein MobC n=1 Tax=Phormidesmis priestleyi ULC007 TaxID=1920490 RepID=A0A2T1D2Z2_9CYAN|nr:hypothetical protein [Phormidesmis priestleyi]PSB14863.1 hypothetical protein C7B65_25715 [Phormidesmis priestleyi ULC007]PZO45857.1 MAG: hypothetical protein DCF14_24515 [Phormidesmis priestleyi]
MSLEVKTERFELRLTPEEKKRLAAKAAQFELSVSAYVRCVIGFSELPHEITEIAEETYFRLGEVHSNLNRVGSNLNQIAAAIGSQLAHQSSDQPIIQTLNTLHLAVDELKETISQLRSQIDETPQPKQRKR